MSGKLIPERVRTNVLHTQNTYNQTKKKVKNKICRMMKLAYSNSVSKVNRNTLIEILHSAHSNTNYMKSSTKFHL